MNKPSQAETIIFRRHFLWWRILGFLPMENYRQLYIVYSIVLNLLITVAFPLHLAIGLFKSNTISDAINSLAIVLTCLLCCVKSMIIWKNFKNIDEIFEITKRQDKRIRLSKDEDHYYMHVISKNARRILNIYMILYLSSWALRELSVVVNGLMGNWDLLYVAYFPFDPFANKMLYTLAHCYQSFGIGVIILQDISNDSFVSMQLALLSGHIHILNMRISKLGGDRSKSEAENNQELLECIKDHKDMLLYRQKLEELISFFMFFQILTISLIMCAIAAFMVLFITDPYTLIYYVSYFLSMTIEILPMCYYGTNVELEFENMPYAIFSSNWVEQDQKFKKNIRIFAEVAKKPLCIMAWIIRINLNSFVIACKNAYSLFALIMNWK